MRRVGGLDGRALEKRLNSLVGIDLVVRITDNLHTMLSFGRSEGRLIVRLHRMFLHASHGVLEALARYIRSGDREASRLLDRYIESNRHLIRKVPAHERRKRFPLRPRGRYHDLQAYFDELCRRHFGRRLSCAITWGRVPRVRLPRRTIKLGSYSADARLIRIHPALDQAHVPPWFVQWIVFHEMLHHVHGVRRGRRRVHTPAFLRDEKRFPYLEEARRWERENLDSLLWWDSRADDGRGSRST
ncbi:MAG: hypothetical protein DIU72_004625 [Pseudomonadota bacterium]|nr:MAG: hypothetical protein DIU72_07450 [Pseudomonadota bacterium]